MQHSLFPLGVAFTSSCRSPAKAARREERDPVLGLAAAREILALPERPRRLLADLCRDLDALSILAIRILGLI